LEAVVWDYFVPSDRLADLAHKRTQFRVHQAVGWLFSISESREAAGFQEIQPENLESLIDLSVLSRFCLSIAL
jgi:hypothetical protein